MKWSELLLSALPSRAPRRRARPASGRRPELARRGRSRLARPRRRALPDAAPAPDAALLPRGCATRPRRSSCSRIRSCSRRCRCARRSSCAWRSRRRRRPRHAAQVRRAVRPRTRRRASGRCGRRCTAQPHRRERDDQPLPAAAAHDVRRAGVVHDRADSARRRDCSRRGSRSNRARPGLAARRRELRDARAPATSAGSSRRRSRR